MTALGKNVLIARQTYCCLLELLESRIDLQKPEKRGLIELAQDALEVFTCGPL
jgi:hypothetical protein